VTASWQRHTPAADRRAAPPSPGSPATPSRYNADADVTSSRPEILARAVARAGGGTRPAAGDMGNWY
jgi:hypothetical protein